MAKKSKHKQPQIKKSTQRNMQSKIKNHSKAKPNQIKFIQKKVQMKQQNMFPKKYHQQKQNNNNIGVINQNCVKIQVQSYLKLKKYQFKRNFQKINQERKQLQIKQKVKIMSLLQRVNTLTAYNQIDWFKNHDIFNLNGECCHLQQIDATFIKQDIENLYRRHIFPQNTALKELNFQFQTLQNYFIAFNITQNSSLKGKLVRLIKKSNFYQQNNRFNQKQPINCSFQLVFPFKKNQTKFINRNIGLRDKVIKKNAFKFLQNKTKFQIQYCLNQETLIIQKKQANQGQQQCIKLFLTKFKFQLIVACEYDQKSHKGVSFIKRNICKAQLCFLAEYYIPTLNIQFFVQDYFCYLKHNLLHVGKIKQETQQYNNYKVKFTKKITLQTNEVYIPQGTTALNIDKQLGIIQKLITSNSYKSQQILLMVTVDCQIVIFNFQNKKQFSYSGKTKKMSDNSSHKNQQKNYLEFRQKIKYRIGFQIQKLVYLMATKYYLYLLAKNQNANYLIKLRISQNVDPNLNLPLQLIYNLSQSQSFCKSDARISGLIQLNQVRFIINGYKNSKIKYNQLIVLYQILKEEQQELNILNGQNIFRISYINIFDIKGLIWKQQIEANQFQVQKYIQNQVFRSGVSYLEEHILIKVNIIYQGPNLYVFDAI